MNIQEIKELIQIMEDSDLSIIEISEGDKKIKLEKNKARAEVIQSYEAVTTEIRPQAEKARGIEIKSPMVGVFYAAASEDSEPFVSVGDSVRKGDVLCVIEAMKLMNEITAEVDGEIAKICVENGQVVEYAQVLFEIV